MLRKLHSKLKAKILSYFLTHNPVVTSVGHCGLDSSRMVVDVVIHITTGPRWWRVQNIYGGEFPYYRYSQKVGCVCRWGERGVRVFQKTHTPDWQVEKMYDKICDNNRFVIPRMYKGTYA